jgi:hypothetical protein
MDAKKIKMETQENKKYVSHLGYDYTNYVKTEENVKDFERLCECESKSKGVALRDCVHYVAEALNLDRKLRGSKAKVYVQGNINNN